MDIASFEDGLDRYGGDLARWPAAERAAAEALLAIAPSARAPLDAMREVEATLRASSARSIVRIDRIAARATAHRQETRARRIAFRAVAGTVAAAVLLLGVLVGGLWSVPFAHDMSPDRVLAAALDTGGVGDVD